MAPSTPNENTPGHPTKTAHIDILVVDDDETWTRTQRRLLERYYDDSTVTTAQSFHAAKTLLGETAPDCLVCDYQLGDGTGLELLEFVRRDRPTLPFILVTGQGDEQVASDAIGERVTDYVRKDDVASQPDLLAKRVESVVDTDRTRQALERERRSKNALLTLVTASTTRQELGQGVCQHLVDDHQYGCAWIGVLDADGGLVPLASAGATDYLATAFGSETNADHKTEPAMVALTTDEIEIVDPLVDAGHTGGCQQVAHDSGFRAAVAVPISHDGVRFGVLTVYKTAPAGFDQPAITLLSEYADTVGYALQATEWRRTLLASTTRTIEITLTDQSVPLVALSTALPPATTIESTTVIPRNDEKVLYLATVSGATAQELRDAVSTVSAIHSVDIYHGGDSVRCGIVVSGPVPETTVVEAGGRFSRTRLTDGRLSLSVVVRADESIRGVVDGFKTLFPDASVTTLWSAQTQQPTGETVELDQLTQRQRQVLELALEAGYFERPRRHNTGELAAMLDISRATFTQHLRAAQSKVFGTLLSTE